MILNDTQATLPKEFKSQEPDNHQNQADKSPATPKTHTNYDLILMPLS